MKSDRASPVCMLPLLLLLNGCDIEPVSAGVWSVQMETATEVVSSTWTIDAAGRIAVAGGAVAILDGSTVLEGSRISWSGTMPNTDNPAAPLNVNFSGTVDRNTLHGTLFTTLGNWSVSGSLQQR